MAKKIKLEQKKKKTSVLLLSITVLSLTVVGAVFFSHNIRIEKGAVYQDVLEKASSLMQNTEVSNITFRGEASNAEKIVFLSASDKNKTVVASAADIDLSSAWNNAAVNTARKAQKQDCSPQWLKADIVVQSLSTELSDLHYTIDIS